MCSATKCVIWGPCGAEVRKQLREINWNCGLSEEHDWLLILSCLGSVPEILSVGYEELQQLNLQGALVLDKVSVGVIS